MTSVNYMQVASWTHCLRCHKNVHKEDTLLHFYTTCQFKEKIAAYPCLCLMPDFDFIPEREGLTW